MRSWPARPYVLSMQLLCTVLLGFGAPLAAAEAALPAIAADSLAIVVNDRDPLSVEIGRYYARRRGVPEDNLVRISFEPGTKVIPRKQFEPLKRRVEELAPATTQAYVLTWAAPWRVGCMSITTAFATGFDEAYCAKPCALTRRSPYFDSNSRAPWSELKLRPTMALAALDMEQARALVERGIASDGTHPGGTGYLVRTSDPRRNVRAVAFPRIVEALGARVSVRYVEAEYVEDANDVLFYFTAGKAIEQMRSNRFLPGAVADHLTSGGGKLTGGRQMSSLRWLEAGATGSYGAVAEPCNFPQKFPDPEIVIRRYTAGETLIEAYWKSVQMPGQGIFIGEPLARPFGDEPAGD